MSGTYDARHKHDLYPAAVIGEGAPVQLPATDVPSVQKGSSAGSERQQEAQSAEAQGGGASGMDNVDAGTKVHAVQLNGSDKLAAREQESMDQSACEQPDLLREAKGPLAKDELKAGD